MQAPRVTIVDYGVGNIGSIANMMKKAGARVDLTDQADAVMLADRLVLPGVGAFDSCASALLSRPGLATAIKERTGAGGCPLLGICVGMQLLAGSSEEGSLPGLDLIAGTARRFDFSKDPAAAQLRVPHMGWSILEPQASSKLLSGLGPSRFYFVHSYHVVCDDERNVAGWATHGVRFAAAIERDNVFGVQFHPEKSHRFGLALFKRFIEI